MHRPDTLNILQGREQCSSSGHCRTPKRNCNSGLCQLSRQGVGQPRQVGPHSHVETGRSTLRNTSTPCLHRCSSLQNSPTACSHTGVIRARRSGITPGYPSWVRPMCLSFLSPDTYCPAGRRVMQFYMLALLDSSPSLRADHEFEHITQHTLNTYLLGEHVAAAWQLGDVLKWSPPSKSMSGPTPKNVGLYKILGGAVEAIVGGVNHQFVRHLTMHLCLLLTSISGWRCFATTVPYTRTPPPPVARNLAGLNRRVPRTR